MQAQIQTIVLFKMKRLFIYKQKEKATTIFSFDAASDGLCRRPLNKVYLLTQFCNYLWQKKIEHTLRPYLICFSTIHIKGMRDETF